MWIARSFAFVCVGSVVVGCGYAPGSYRRFDAPFAGTRERVGCLDVAFQGRREHVTTNPVIEFSFGNRCDFGVDVDFTSVRVLGRTAAGTLPLVAVDPRDEIRVARLDGRVSGRELIEYRAAEPVSDADPIVSLCVDVTRLDRSATEPARWTCAPANPTGMGGAR